MKIPQKPPIWQDVIPEFLRDSRKLVEFIGRVPGPLHNGRYVHWDKLKHLSPPAGMNSEQWWAILKIHRRSLLKPLPLQDKAGTPFQYALPDPAIEMLHTLDKNAAGQILVSDPIGDPATRDRYIINSLMEEAITSSQMEGAATTRVVAKEMLRTGRKPRDRGERMIANNYAAMQRIRALKDTPLSVDVIFELHRILARDAIDDAGAVGRARSSDERVVVEDQFNELLHEPPHAAELESRMKAMCDFANGRSPAHFVHPVIRAIILHFWLAYDHPFVDGNGRCARSLFYWSMLSSGYWLCEFVSISQLIRKAHAKYGRAFLYTETDDNDLTYFILYHLDILCRSIDVLRSYLKDSMSKIRDVERRMRDGGNLNHRQMALIGHALRHRDAAYTIASHRNSHNIVYETARKDLIGLLKAGLLESRKRGNTDYFFPVVHLDEKLKRLK